MKIRPKVSVIMATYNRASMIEQSVYSVLNQTIKNLELLIIDDGSTDETEILIKNLQKKDNRIKYFQRHHSGNVAGPINFGILQSKGEYVTFHASDDETEPTWLEEQIDVFKRPNGSITDVSSCNILVIDSDGKKEEISKPLNTDNEYIIRTSLTHNYIFGNLLARQGFFQKTCMYDESLKSREDFDVWIRLLDMGYKFDFVYKPLYIVHKHEGQTSNLDPIERIKINEYLLEKHKKIYHRYPWILSEDLRVLGINIQVLLGDQKKARKIFVQAIQFNILNIKAYFFLATTFLNKKTLHLLRIFKRKIFPLK
jgi:glycosyltransferase involved in cell wall biosynthesis